MKTETDVNPDSAGYFGRFGGRYVAETLMPALLEIERVYREVREDPSFQEELAGWQRDYIGRPSSLYFARRLSEEFAGARIFLKREDLNHTGAHKINNTIGQALLARRMGKTRLMAETGAGQHGVATATVAALFGMDCVIYMGEEDIRRQAPNVLRMRMLGATVQPVRSGARTLKDAMSEALRAWVAEVDRTFYVIGTVAGPHPYPLLVRDFQSVIGREARAQFLEKQGRLPDQVIACVGGGSNAAGMFNAFLGDSGVHLIGVEAAGHGVETGAHAASLGAGEVGILHGSRSFVLQDPDGQIQNAHSISAGLDYPGVGPEHAFWAESGAVEYVSIRDDEAVSAFHRLVRREGIVPALESSHAVAEALKRAAGLKPDQTILVCLSGRGDKDLDSVLAFDAAAAAVKETP
ncbi:MAG: tryptophan synthase subunit beta [Kiritimatiellia bacterium]|nr:tryptophan synthase subunit beta [Kiritimatiellia bacterium]